MTELAIIIALILFNGILAMSEIALISAKKSYLSHQAKKGSTSAKLALKLANQPDKFLSTIQIGITAIGILTGIYSGSVLASDLAVILGSWGISGEYAYTVAQTVIVVAVTYFTLVFGELVPKRIGMALAGSAAKVVSRPMYILSIVAMPFVWILSKSTSFIFNLLGFKHETDKVTEAEIRSLIEEGTKDGEIQEVEHDIVERVFVLGDLKVSSLMTHRSEINPLDINMPLAQIKKVIESTCSESYTVISRDFDDVRGVVLLKDIIFKLNNSDFNLERELKPAEYFHENMQVYKALEQMKEKRLSEALICDEYGVCQGAITLKDILEGLVGTINDAQSEPDIVKRKSGEGWLVDGQMPLYDFLAYFDKETLYVSHLSYSTVGGLILDILGHIPSTGETAQWNEFRFEIVDMDSARIDKILVVTD